jgi:cell division protein FtsI (penicillin-binding protein 3)
VIAVAVVLDNPKGGGISYYGGAASAPVFTQVAQDTLEYLGVAHDVEVHAARTPAKNLTAQDAEPEQEHTGDVNALLSAVNDLPPDDPLREAVSNARTPKSESTVVKVAVNTSAKEQAKKAEKAADSAKSAASKPNPAPAPEIVAVSLPVGNTVKVPSLIGMPVRQVVEQVAIAGLNLQVEGRGLVRAQEPAAGTPVQPGSQVTVHCAR